jgi:hypothetical protein
MSSALSLAARFWKKVHVTDGCWLWQGALSKDGYGRFSFDHTYAYAHRWAYEYMRGPIRDGLTLDHLCRNRGCVNPDHLEPVTIRENTLRGEGPTAQRAAMTHCPKGHEFTPENTYVRPATGHRQCRACKLERQRRHLKNKRSALAADTPTTATAEPDPHCCCGRTEARLIVCPVHPDEWSATAEGRE